MLPSHRAPTFPHSHGTRSPERGGQFSKRAPQPRRSADSVRRVLDIRGNTSQVATRARYPCATLRTIISRKRLWRAAFHGPRFPAGRHTCIKLHSSPFPTPRKKRPGAAERMSQPPSIHRLRPDRRDDCREKRRDPGRPLKWDPSLVAPTERHALSQATVPRVLGARRSCYAAVMEPPLILGPANTARQDGAPRRLAADYAPRRVRMRRWGPRDPAPTTRPCPARLRQPA